LANLAQGGCGLRFRQGAAWDRMQHESLPTSGYDHACSARTGSGPRAMATLRNLAVDALQLATEATRWVGRYIDRPFTILGLAS
jgi:hypothetical protein